MKANKLRDMIYESLMTELHKQGHKDPKGRDMLNDKELEEAKRPEFQKIPNEAAYADFKQYAKKKKKAIVGILRKAMDDNARNEGTYLFLGLRKIWLAWAKKDAKEWSKIPNNGPEGSKFGRALAVMLKKDNLIIKRSTNKLTDLDEGLWANINAKKKRGEKSAPKGSKAYKAAKKAGDKLEKTKESVSEGKLTESRGVMNYVKNAIEDLMFDGDVSEKEAAMELVTAIAYEYKFKAKIREGKLDEVSTINKRRAGAELKQKLKGKRSDGLGKYTATIYGMSNGKRVELKGMNDLNKYSEFEIDESVNEISKEEKAAQFKLKLLLKKGLRLSVKDGEDKLYTYAQELDRLADDEYNDVVDPLFAAVELVQDAGVPGKNNVVADKEYYMYIKSADKHIKTFLKNAKKAISGMKESVNEAGSLWKRFDQLQNLRSDSMDLEQDMMNIAATLKQLHKNMEQEAEPEGGKVADNYGKQLDKYEKMYKERKAKFKKVMAKIDKLEQF